MSTSMSNLLNGLLALYVGPPSSLTPEDDLCGFDNTAYLVEGRWKAEFVISVFERQGKGKLERVAANLLKHVSDVKEEEIIWNRFQYFLAEPSQNVNLVLRQDVDEEFAVGPTLHNGIMSVEVTVPESCNDMKQGDIVEFKVLTPPGYPETHTLCMAFGSEDGMGIISDIDDTIKVSQVLDRVALVKNTFTNPNPQAVEGMPELYKSLYSRYRPTFFYLSASPWQLYPFLRNFIKTYYPFGQIILRDMSYMELSSFLASLTVGTQEYKQDRIEKIHYWFPNKKFLCIGDSTQTDPETFGAMYRKYPGWIKGIWIRVVEGVDPDAEKELNAPERFEKAFKDIPRDVWRTFKSPTELMAINI